MSKLHTIWAKCKANEKYLISIDGDLMTPEKLNGYDTRGRERKITQKLLKKRIDYIERASGRIYKRVKYVLAGKSYVASRLVVDTFIGIQNKANDIDHLDGNPENNKIENLEEVSRLVNIRRARRMGLYEN